MISQEDIRVVYADMPCSVKAYTIRKDDYYTIVLNSMLSYEQNKISYEHELRHIMKRDFDSLLPAGILEINAHN